MFNRVLARRMEEGTLDALLPGDIAFEHGTGETFRVTEEMAADDALRERVARLEVSATGPLWGAEMMLADGAPGRAESAELSREGVSETDLEEVMRRFGKPASGTRRPLRARVIEPEVEGGADEHGAFIRTKFQLDPGVFATSVLREVMKVFPLECSHIARRGGHDLVCRDPSDPPAAEREGARGDG
jgi:tRNA(Glu) U13 pseudouridine synthase TruD